MKPIIFSLALAALALLMIMPSSAYFTEGTYPLFGTGPAFNASIPGERNAGQWFVFTLLNVSGYSDVKYHFTLYDAYILDSYDYRSDAWGQWWTEYPDSGNKFLFVWICGWCEGTSWIGWGSDRFFAWINSNSLKPEPVQFSDIGKVRKGTTFTNNVPPRTIRWLENRTSYLDFVWSDDPYGFKDGIEVIGQEPGKSNALQGYLIYQIPRDAQLKDIRIAGWFGHYGTAWWNLEKKMFTQDSPEYLVMTERENHRREIDTGIRVKDDYIIRSVG